MNVVPVTLPGRDYEVRIGPGLLQEAGRHIAPLLHAFDRAPIVPVVIVIL